MTPHDFFYFLPWLAITIICACVGLFVLFCLCILMVEIFFILKDLIKLNF